MIELHKRAQVFASSIAIQDERGSYTYQDLLNDSGKLAFKLQIPKNPDQPIAYLIKPGFNYVAAQWGIWQSGHIAVPLCPEHPLPALQHVLEDTACQRLVVDECYKTWIAPLAKKLGIKLIDLNIVDLPIKTHIEFNQRALILYTSGTTSLPKGVVLTHRNIEAQMQSLSQAWHWSAEDKILNVLPLHHVHGIVNVVCCALWNGASCQFLSKFEPKQVFETFTTKSISLFMAVPTIYHQLIQYWNGLSVSHQESVSACLKSLRLMVSGSAALPLEILNTWKKISSHTLLERYGMTEIGMALSNSYLQTRHPGLVGLPLPGVQIQVVANNREVEDGEDGEIWVKGPTVFEEYWKLPTATSDSFSGEWFKTGDIAKKTINGYKILGRNSVDIIKSGGYKISALEIEDVLLQHANINECAVVGLPDTQWGEVICATLVVSKTLTSQSLDLFVLKYLPKYKKPRRYVFLSELPRNTLGKIMKPLLKEVLLKEQKDP